MNLPTNPTDDAIEQSLRDSRGLEDAPEALIRRTIAAMQALPAAQAQSAPGGTLLQRIVAALTFDSGQAPTLAFGMRSGDGATRQLLFAAQGHDVDLRVAAAAPGSGDWWLISGQVLGPQTDGEVALTDDGGTPIAQGPLNELGEFRLPAVARGRYTVNLRLGRLEVVLPGLQVP
jgi:hypothetical protein